MDLNGASDDLPSKRVFLPAILCAHCALCGESTHFEFKDCARGRAFSGTDGSVAKVVTKSFQGSSRKLFIQTIHGKNRLRRN